jgi:hypothetical protein
VSEFEQQIRDTLRRADAEPMPVAPIDPEEITGRTPTHTPGGGRRWLAAAAVVTLVAGIGLGAWALRGPGAGVPATPVAPATTPAATGAGLDVELHVGREIHSVPLDPKVTQELYLMLADHEAAGLLHKTGSPDFALGAFGGFVLTPADPSLPELRILPTRVIVHRAGDYQQLQDPNELFYNRVYDAISPLLDTDVRKALPPTKPEIPTITATIPPSKGATATWTLANPKAISITSDSLQLTVTRLECANGKTGKILEPEVSIGTADIIIRTDAAPISRGAGTCQANKSVSLTIILAEPIGNRSLIDAACLAGEAVRTSSCASGATRWTP